MSEIVHQHITRVLATHRRIQVSDSGSVVCQCSVQFPNEVAFVGHVVQIVELSIEDAIGMMVMARTAAALRAMTAYWGPNDKGSTSRSRAVYTGSQFAGWLKEQARSLHRQAAGGYQQPPRTGASSE